MLHIDVGLFNRREFQKGFGFEAEQACDHRVRELFDADIVDIDRFVVQLAPVGNGVFQAGNPLLKLHEIIVGLEFRVGFGNGKNLPEAHAQHSFGLAEGLDILGFACRLNARASFDHSLQRVLFELFVLLANLDQFRQLIMALLEQHINVGPSLGDTMFECNQTVIELSLIHI